MDRMTLVLVWCGLFVIILLGQIVLAGGYLERSLAEQAQRHLSAANAAWAAVSFSGRDATVAGEAPDAMARQAALDAVSQVAGVRVVTDDIAIP